MKSAKFLVLVFLLSGFVLQGCVTTAPPSPPFGAAAAIYSDKELQTTYPDTVFRVNGAARKALNDLGITVNSAQQDMTGGTIEATKKDGTKVTVWMRAKKPDMTVVNIRVGDFGDEKLSRDISKKIESNLKV